MEEPKIFDIELEKLIPTEKNPRQLSKQGYENLKYKMEKYPKFITAREVVIDENFNILGGHQRVAVAKKKGDKTIRVKQVFGWSQEERDNFIIADNIADGEWDNDKLANEWDPDDLLKWGMYDVKKNIQDEKEIKDNPPSIVSSFVTFDYSDEIELFIEDETAVKLMSEMIEYKEKKGTYNGFWDERLK